MKTRRHMLILYAFAAVALAAVAADMSGDWNSWLGKLAGHNADGNRSTMQGAGAGGEARSLVRTDLVGAAAGMYSSNVTDCVGIGFAALSRSTNMSGVVAIGDGALSNRVNMTRATWINGQFGAFAQNNTFWVRPNPDMPATNAPIYYADGVLHLNGTVRLNGGEMAGGSSGGDTPGASLIGYDYYVDPVNGSDAFPGTSPGSPKQTIAAAYASVTTNDMSICLLPGVHVWPQGHVGFGGMYSNDLHFADWRVRFVAPSGWEHTIIDGGGTNHMVGCASAFTTIDGVCIRNFAQGRNYRPLFTGLHFTNCTFRGELRQKGLGAGGGLFGQCVFGDCDVDVTRIFDHGEADPSPAWDLASCAAENTTFRLASTNAPTRFAQYTMLRNCFVWTASAKTLFVVSPSYSPVIGEAGLTDCTVICPAADEGFSCPASGCLLGINATNAVPEWSGASDTIVTNAATIEAIIGDDYRPAVTNWRYRYTGYKSGPERATRNSMLESIRAALEAASTE